LKFAENLGKDFAMLDNDDSSDEDDASIPSCDGIEMSTKVIPTVKKVKK